MKKLFVSSDIHGFYDQYIKALNGSGFDITNPEHILLICGDIFDRGYQAKELLNFLLSIPQKRLILIRGNHEDLFDDCMNEIKQKNGVSWHHIQNGTLDTISQLTGISTFDLRLGVFDYKKDILTKLKPYYKLIKKCKNYFETKTHIFVHGFIPTSGEYYIVNWRDLPEADWKVARWSNGIDCCFKGQNRTGKIIVCGHWHCSHAWYLSNPKKYHEIGDDSNFNPYMDDKLCAIDGCTPYSGKVNVITFNMEA